MSSKWGFIMGVCLVCANAFAADESPYLKNLVSRIHSLPNSKGSLIQSFEKRDQSYVYDQALAIIAFSKAGMKKEARSLLQGMSSLQLKDGSLYFSYYLNGISPYPQEGDKRFAGALAWVALSVGHYQSAFNSKEFISFHEKLLSYLAAEMKPVSINGNKALALKFNPTNVSETSWNETNTAALEHNLDLYAALKLYSQLNSKSKWKSETSGLKTFILSLWDSQRSHFWSGADLATGAINKEEIYLDNQTWSLLALDAETLKEINITAALELNCEELYTEHNGAKGFMDRRPVRGPFAESFVWSEGTLGHVLAVNKAQDLQKKELKCQGKKNSEILNSLTNMKTSDGGIAYATSATNPDFTTSSSVAGTAWMYFALARINPFQR